MPNSKDLTEALQNNFLSKEKFVNDIEQMVKSGYSSYIDAIVDYCSDNNIEIESIKSLVNKQLKEKLRFEYSELNCLKSTSRAKLPI